MLGCLHPQVRRDTILLPLHIHHHSTVSRSRTPHSSMCYINSQHMCLAVTALATNALYFPLLLSDTRRTAIGLRLQSDVWTCIMEPHNMLLSGELEEGDLRACRRCNGSVPTRQVEQYSILQMRFRYASMWRNYVARGIRKHDSQNMSSNHCAKRSMLNCYAPRHLVASQLMTRSSQQEA
jgi:hypothetical protein